jgi:hypothetical protein
MLGVAFVVAYPFGRDWGLYAIAVVVAVVFALVVLGRVRLTVLEFSETDTERIYIVRQVWRKRRLGYRPLSRRTLALIAIGWIALFVAIAFLPDDQSVGADVLLVVVTLIWIAYRMGRRRGAASAPSADSDAQQQG